MPKQAGKTLLEGLSHDRTRHGKVRWFYRTKFGKKQLRGIHDEPPLTITQDVLDAYMDARERLEGLTGVNRTPGSLGWLLDRYIDSISHLSPLTIADRKSIAKGMMHHHHRPFRNIRLKHAHVIRVEVGLHVGNSNATLLDCTFTNNSAELGGGICVSSRGTLTLTDCTFTNNLATSQGGGLHNPGFITGPPIPGAVFSGNVAGACGGGAPGGPAGVRAVGASCGPRRLWSGGAAVRGARRAGRRWAWRAGWSWGRYSGSMGAGNSTGSVTAMANADSWMALSSSCWVSRRFSRAFRAWS